jgi:sulfur-oxidizing protein SoxA
LPERFGVTLLLLACFYSGQGSTQEQRSFAARNDLPPQSVQSGFEFLTRESQLLQQDSFANPGYLWVDKGRVLFGRPAGAASCLSCHAQDGARSLVGAAARYPAFDEVAGTLLNLEGRINQCRTRQQRLPELAYESDELLSLTAYVASLSRGMPYAVSIDGPSRPFFERGRAYFFRRKGQLNLACNQCHDDNWGKRLRGDRISQGHGNGYPGYRMEWQSFGSLHRRIRDCDIGVRAAPEHGGSAVYKSVELYLAWRAANLPIESPGIRR